MSIKSAYITSVIAFMRPKIQPPKVFHWIQSNLIRFTASCPDYQLHRTTPSHSMKLVKHRPIFIYGGRSVNQNSIPSNSVSLDNRFGSSMFKLSSLYQLSMSIRIRSSSMGAVAWTEISDAMYQLLFIYQDKHQIVLWLYLEYLLLQLHLSTTTTTSTTNTDCHLHKYDANQSYANQTVTSINTISYCLCVSLSHHNLLPQGKWESNRSSSPPDAGVEPMF